MVPPLGLFGRRFPKLTLELVMNDANIDFVRDRIDLAIRLARAIEGDLICSTLRPTRYLVCASI